MRQTLSILHLFKHQKVIMEDVELIKSHTRNSLNTRRKKLLKNKSILFKFNDHLPKRVKNPFLWNSARTIEREGKNVDQGSLSDKNFDHQNYERAESVSIEFVSEKIKGTESQAVTKIEKTASN